jgi:hypothetical protein
VHDIIEPLLHKAAVRDLLRPIRNSGLSIGDTAQLHLTEDGRIAVWATLRYTRFFLPRRSLLPLGHLGADAGQILTPALRRGDHLRVRVVGLTPEHLSPDGQAEMHISVWGNARYLPAPLTRKGMG